MQQVIGVGPHRPSGARFVFLSNLPAQPSGAFAGELVTWRLTAANNRTLGRSTRWFADIAACLDDARELHLNADRATVSMQFNESGAGEQSYWSWSILLDGRPVAESTHNHQRRLECIRAHGNFVTAAAETMPVPVPARRLGRRLGLCPT